MEVLFDNPKLQKTCEDDKALSKYYGTNAKMIRRRLEDLEKFAHLKDYLAMAPGKPHSLEGNRKGQYAVSVSASKRMIFIPKTEIPKDENGFPDFAQIVSVIILALNLDYHGD